MPEAGSETLTKDHAEAEATRAPDAGQPGLSGPGVRAVAAVPQDAANPQAASRPEPAGRRMTELRVSGHLMTLEDGLFCVFHSPGSSTAAADSGLPGVRISLGPGSVANPRAVEISTFRNDGWLSGNDDAALVRVAGGPAQVLVTVYQSARGREAPPKLQVIRLTQESGVRAAAPVPKAAVAANPVPPAPPPADAGAEPAEIAAHVQLVGDCTAPVGQWIGERGSKRWIEGFSIAPRTIGRDDIEYQAVLGRGWVSPWVAGGAFCGSRGMALPVLGLRVRLRGAASSAFACSVSASFIDGTETGPVAEGEACEADSLAPLEAFQVVLTPRASAPAVAAMEESPQAATPPRTPKPSVAKSSVTKPSVKAAVKAALVRVRQPAPVPAKPRGRR